MMQKVGESEYGQVVIQYDMIFMLGGFREGGRPVLFVWNTQHYSLFMMVIFIEGFRMGAMVILDVLLKSA